MAAAVAYVTELCEICNAPLTKASALPSGATASLVGELIGLGSSPATRASPVGGVRNGTYRDAVTGREVTVGDGNLSFQVRGNSAGIYVLDGPGRIGEDELYLR